MDLMNTKLKNSHLLGETWELGEVTRGSEFYLQH